VSSIDPSFLVMGGASVLAYSKDGVSATKSSSGSAIFSTGNAVMCIGFNGKQWIAGGGGDQWMVGGARGTKMAISKDGMEWTNVASMDKLGGDFSVFTSILWTGSRWLVTSVGMGKTYSSTDGNTWTALTAPANINKIAGNDNILCGCGFNAMNGAHAMFYSKDIGKTWTLAPSADPFFTPLGGGLWAIEYNGKLFVAVGNASASGAEGTIIYSTDGINWIKCTLPDGPKTQRFFGIVWGGGMWWAQAQYGGLYSTDGINWKKDKKLPNCGEEGAFCGNLRIPTNYFPGCGPIYNGKGWYTMSYNGQAVYNSTDLFKWSDSSLNVGLSSVFPSGSGRAIACAKVLPW
jgi:hypothetical protein